MHYEGKGLICRALLHEFTNPRWVLSTFGYQMIRTDTGMPSVVIRLRMLHPIFASVR